MIAVHAGEVADLLDLSEHDVVERMLKHALPPLVEAGNRSALEVLAGKIGSDPQHVLQNYGHTIIAKCLYEGMETRTARRLAPGCLTCRLSPSPSENFFPHELMMLRR
jgi:hypothetical protein